jgi:hypothetical protein
VAAKGLVAGAGVPGATGLYTELVDAHGAVETRDQKQVLGSLCARPGVALPGRPARLRRPHPSVRGRAVPAGHHARNRERVLAHEIQVDVMGSKPASTHRTYYWPRSVFGQSRASSSPAEVPLGVPSAAVFTS